MADYTIVLPSKPKVLHEDGNSAVFEIDGLYPGYGHTLGNSLRRIILSSLPGAAITAVKITGVEHEFSTIAGIKEDVITILLNLKRIHISLNTDEPERLSLKVKGVREVTAADLETPGQVVVLNPEQHIATITNKNTELEMELTVEKGLGYVPKEVLQKEKVEIGTIALDAAFTPIRRVNYEVENMRVGNRTDFNRLKIFIETDGTIMPREALDKAIEIMITQLKAIVGFQEETETKEPARESDKAVAAPPAESKQKEFDQDFLKTRIESLNLSAKTITALANANIRTLGGLVRKKEEDILDIDGLGGKGVQEIKKALQVLGITLK